MKQITKTITSELQALSNAEKREIFPRFFKAGKGEYGEGDRFSQYQSYCQVTQRRIHRGDTEADTVRMA